MDGDNDYVNEINLPDIVSNISSKKFFFLNKSFLAAHSYSGRFLVCSETDSVTCSDIYSELDEPEQYKKVEHQYFFTVVVWM